MQPLDLCRNPLPWVDGAKHLGNFIENRIDGLKKDIRMKRAEYINKNYDTVAVLRNVHVCTCVHCVKRKKTKVTN